MSIISSVSQAIQESFNLVTDVAKTTQESLSVGTEYIHNRASSQKLTDKEIVRVSTAKTLTELKTELDSDEELKKMYDSLNKMFD